MEREDFIDKIETYGTIPIGKFGHTSCLISKTKLVVFGGANGDVGNYSITNDTFILTMQANPLNFSWKLLESTLLPYNLDVGNVPSPRAAHACCSFEENQMLVFGGATGCKNLSPL